MAINLDDIKQKLPENLQKHSNLKTVAGILVILFALSLLSLVLLQITNKKDYAVLFANLGPHEAGQVLTELQKENIPYKIEGNGSIILVPEDQVYEVRLKLASKGIPSGGGTIGFELFNEPKLGITQFQENINYIRALEGELERTIRQIDAVVDAKVNIALPKESIFMREEDQPKASVIVKLYPGKDLTKEQVKAIVFLVSRAVPKLKPDNITVVDNQGRVLSDLLDEDSPSAIADKNVEIKRKLERQIEKNIQSMLAKALGPEKVIVRATVEIETGKLKQQDEIYDPDKTAVVSERRIKEEIKTKKKNEIGPPGTSTNVPPIMDLEQDKYVIEKKKDDKTKNYDVSKSIIQKSQPIFKIKKISVGVLIDGKYEKIKDKDGNEKYQFKPRPPEEIKQYEELIKSAIGYDPKRGDKVTVVSVPFETKVEKLVKESEKKAKMTTKNIILLAATMLIGLSLLIVIIAIVLKSKRQKRLELQEGYGGLSPDILSSMASAKEREETTISIEKEPAYIKIMKLADENPQILAMLISQWLKED
ncbi:MAG TPA: flagellar M-ring protein FliF [Persephonella sp.]|nr:flagellar M-ring protein FliF [Persephonella sp.]